VPIYVAASGPLAAKLAGRVGDGFICTSGKKPELYEELFAKVAEGAEQAGRDPGEVRKFMEVKVSYDRDLEKARRACDWWGALALTPEQKEGVEDPLEMERLADLDPDKAQTRSSSPTIPRRSSSGSRPTPTWGWTTSCCTRRGRIRSASWRSSPRTACPRCARD
jgi:coenzyme F420-dependent glucose-6-phosphate dehydrogenase